MKAFGTHKPEAIIGRVFQFMFPDQDDDEVILIGMVMGLEYNGNLRATISNQLYDGNRIDYLCFNEERCAWGLHILNGQNEVIHIGGQLSLI